MEAKDLRIGNFVNDKLYGDYEIIGMVTTPDGANVVFKDMKYYPKSSDISKLNPIPLTEEWLLKFGFEKYRGSQSFELGKLSLLQKSEDHPNGRVYFNSWAILENKIEYVHQLQNLFYCLCGEELEIK